MQIGSLPTTSQMPIPSTGGEQKQKTNFASLISQYTQHINHDVKSANAAAANLAEGKGGDTTETLLAVQKAGLSFQLMLASRNKLVEAYREVMRMQV